VTFQDIRRELQFVNPAQVNLSELATLTRLHGAGDLLKLWLQSDEVEVELLLIQLPWGGRGWRNRCVLHTRARMAEGVGLLWGYPAGKLFTIAMERRGGFCNGSSTTDGHGWLSPG
jgi:hypothetical protein